MPSTACGEPIGGITPPGMHGDLARACRFGELGRERGITHRCGTGGPIEDHPQLGGAEQGHRRHGDEAGLHHRKPGGRHPAIVEAAEEDTIPRDEPELTGQDMRERIDVGRERRVGDLVPSPRAIRYDEGDAVAMPFTDRVIEEARRAVEPRRIVIGRLEVEHGPLRHGRELCACPVVLVSGGMQGGHGVPRAARSVSRPMRRRCTSLAPS